MPWECVPPLYDATIKQVKALGGIAAIAISHPQHYTTIVEWRRAFGDVPIHLHNCDANRILRPDDRIKFWDGATKSLVGGLTLLHTGGYFNRFRVLHWPGGANRMGVLLAGDQPAVCVDRQWVTFTYSYPNMIALGPPAIRKVAASLKPFACDRLCSAFPDQVVKAGAKATVERSAQRYLRAIGT